MTIALAFESDDGSRAIATHVQVNEQEGVRDHTIEIQDYYEISSTVEIIRQNKFRRIALQFPDSLLPDAYLVQQALQNALKESIDSIFVLGDTSYGSCCVDEVAAQHLSGDCIIHYGRTCLSATSKLPVIYVFGRAIIDIDDCKTTLLSHLARIPGGKTILLLFEPCYNYISKEMMETLRQNPRRGDSENMDSEAPAIILGTLSNFYNPNNRSDTTDDKPVKSINIGGYTVALTNFAGTTISPENSSFLYVGDSENMQLTSILMRYSAIDCFSYNPVENILRKEGRLVNQCVMRRYFLMQKAKEAQIFGILMGTLGVANYLEVARALQRLIKQAGRKSYMFVVGKVNVPKLANYAEIDAFVLVACQQNSLMDSREFYKPIVTPYEVLVALNEAGEYVQDRTENQNIIQWDGHYKTAFSEVRQDLVKALEIMESSQSICLHNDKPFYSLVTGTYHSASNYDSDNTHGLQNLQIQDNNSEQGILTTNYSNSDIIQYHSEAGEFLASRLYKGLEPRIGETEAHAAIEGDIGIAQGYTSANSDHTITK